MRADARRTSNYLLAVDGKLKVCRKEETEGTIGSDWLGDQGNWLLERAEIGHGLLVRLASGTESARRTPFFGFEGSSAVG
jgi:hypothetical protein